MWTDNPSFLILLFFDSLTCSKCFAPIMNIPLQKHRLSGEMEITLNQLDYSSSYLVQFVNAMPPQAVPATLIIWKRYGMLQPLISSYRNHDFLTPDRYGKSSQNTHPSLIGLTDVGNYVLL